MYKLMFYITQDPVANNTLQTFKVSVYCFNDTPAKTTKTTPLLSQGLHLQHVATVDTRIIYYQPSSRQLLRPRRVSKGITLRRNQRQY